MYSNFGEICMKSCGCPVRHDRYAPSGRRVIHGRLRGVLKVKCNALAYYSYFRARRISHAQIGEKVFVNLVS